MVTVRYAPRPGSYVRDYQFVLRNHGHIGELVGSFDLSCAQIGWSPYYGVFASPLAGFALAAGVLIVDPSRRNPTFESRLIKYVNVKKFRLVFPSLNKELFVKPLILACDSPRQVQVDNPVGMRFCGNKPHRDPNFLVVEEDDDDDGGYGFSGGGYRRRRVRRYRPNRNSSRDYYGLDQYTRLLLRNLALAARGDVDSRDVMMFEAKTFDLLKSNPAILGLSEAAHVFSQRAFLKDQKISLEMLKCFKNWFGTEDFLKFIHARIEQANEKAICEIVDRVIDRVEERLESIECPPFKWLKSGDPFRHSLAYDVNRSAAAWYGPERYEPTSVGLPTGIASALTSLRIFCPLWRMLPKDIYNLVVQRYLIPFYRKKHLLTGCSVKDWIVREFGSDDEEEEGDVEEVEEVDEDVESESIESDE